MKKINILCTNHKRTARDLAQADDLELPFLFISEIMKYKAEQENKRKKRLLKMLKKVNNTRLSDKIKSINE